MLIRDALNQAGPNNLADALRDLGFGDLVNTLINNLPSTETGVTVTTNQATLAGQPTSFFEAEATTGTTLGKKKLLIGPITGPSAIVPATGQAVWDAGLHVLFATVDAVTVAKFTYAKASDALASVLQRDVGIRNQ